MDWLFFPFPLSLVRPPERVPILTGLESKSEEFVIVLSSIDFVVEDLSAFLNSLDVKLYDLQAYSSSDFPEHIWCKAITPEDLYDLIKSSSFAGSFLT